MSARFIMNTHYIRLALRRGAALVLSVPGWRHHGRASRKPVGAFQ